MSTLPWVRVSNATQDPHTKCSVAQDQIVKIVGEDGDWYSIETIEGSKGRVPKVLTLPITDPNRLPGQLIYCSTDAYTSIRTDDLSFAPSSLFVARPSKQHEGYLEGYMITDKGAQLGSSGLLPEGYLVHIPTPSDQKESSTGISTSFTTNFNELDVKFRNLPPPSAGVSSSYNVAPYARAIYDFQGEFANELSFSADEIISLRRRIDQDWLEGSIGSGRVGIFPISFVQIIVNLPDDEEHGSIVASDKRRSTSTENDGIGFANVKHAFIGRQSDELSVNAGDTVRVLRMVNDEWVMCKDPDSDRTGIVPVGFLELYLDDEDDDNMIGSKKHSETTFSTLSRSSFVAPPAVADWRTSTRLEPTTSIQNEWSTFDNGAISSTNKGNQWATFGEDWISAEQQPKTSAPARPPPPKQSSIQSPNDVVSVTEMFGMSERQAPPRPNAPSSMFLSANDFETGLQSATSGASSDEDKRARILEELINSELQFITDINSYTEAVDASQLLTNKQKVIMRNGCAQIVQLSANLVQLLTNEQMKQMDSQQIGTCFLQLRKPFAQTYGYYFRNIEHINQLLTSAKTEKTMEEALQDVVRRMRESGAGAIDGATAVGRPVQRCLKYPLFLNEIVKLTPLNHSDHPKLLEAVKTMSNLGQKMNESKRRKELTRKYMAEDRQTFGEMLSKMTFHSLKKKSNRFTYRMGSSLGVVKLLRDVEFDNLVCELDSAERRLVRFNYMLVIYRKKMFHETRFLLQKKVVEPRKKALSSNDIDHQLYAFNEAVREYAGIINTRVRDQIVKALRSIPKRLIKKRNDKLMDYEAAKSKEKGSAKREFAEIQKDYEALNVQVKQELPKNIEFLNKTLVEAMQTVSNEDSKLMDKMKNLFDEAKNNHIDEARRLFTSTTPYFAAYYDSDRLKPLQRIANKGAQSIRTRARSVSPSAQNGSYSKSALKKPAASTKTIANPVVVQQQQWSSDSPSIPDSFASAAVAAVAVEKSSENSTSQFRAQTAEERRTILEKATAKNRLQDMYIAMSHYPQDPGMLKLAMTEGKLLIVRQGDMVLAVNRDLPSMWLCYNGYYNAMLPSGILRQFTKASGGPQIDTGVDVVKTLAHTTTTTMRSHSTPPKSQNLIDLEDLFGGGASLTTNIQPLVPAAVQPVKLSPIPLQPTTSYTQKTKFDWNAAAKTLPLAPAPPVAPQSLTFQPTQQSSLIQSPLAQVNYNLDDTSLFDGVASIDWGSASNANANASAAEKSAVPSMYENTPEYRRIDYTTQPFDPANLPDTAPPPLAVIMNPAKEFMDAFSTSSANDSSSVTFPVSFDDAPSSSLLPPIQQRSVSAADKPVGQVAAWPTNPTIRSDSPQPLIPSRPAPTVRNNVYPTLPAAYDFPPLQPTIVSAAQSTTTSAKAPLYSDTMSTTYAVPPMYDTTPSITNATNAQYDAPPAISNPSFAQYDAPPSIIGSQYDQPPSEQAKKNNSPGAIRPVLCEVRADYDFVPQGSNQVAVNEGETVGVLQRTDDDGNPEWLLVKRSNGQVGYVPAAYCRPV